MINTQVMYTMHEMSSHQFLTHVLIYLDWGFKPIRFHSKNRTIKLLEDSLSLAKSDCLKSDLLLYLWFKSSCVDFFHAVHCST